MKFYKEYKRHHYFWDKILKNRLNCIYIEYNCYNSYIWFFKNGKLHNNKNAAYIHDEYKEFHLNDIYYGISNKFTKESWRKFCKLKVFL